MKQQLWHCQALKALGCQRVQGRVSIPFKEVARSKRIKDNYALQGVRHGHLTLSLSWLGISDAN